LKTSLSNLPEHKQEELRSITEDIVALLQPEMVILYGSHSRGDWVEDSYVEDHITYEYSSDYDILVITKHQQDTPFRVAKQTKKKIRRSRKTKPQLIFHDIKFVNTELEEGHYFFVDIQKEGTMLYDTGNFQLATPKDLSPTERARLAQQYYDVKFKDGNSFMRQYHYAINDNDLKIAIFLLHQATERYYQTILLVFTHYKPKTHDLKILNKDACASDLRIKKVFPNKTEDEKHRFDVLVKAYIDSRYKLDYTVVPEELEWLGKRVQMLKELTELVCKEEIQRFRDQPGG
jgi:predicted nucleotidyltransferase/HEPN domain-containing protein